MKTWVFNEQMLDQALADWGAAEFSGDYADEREASITLIKEFLASEQARKLRVQQNDPHP